MKFLHSAPSKMQVFSFISLYTNKIIVLKIFISFICPSSIQKPVKKIILIDRRNFGTTVVTHATSAEAL